MFFSERNNMAVDLELSGIELAMQEISKHLALHCYKEAAEMLNNSEILSVGAKQCNQGFQSLHTGKEDWDNAKIRAATCFGSALKTLEDMCANAGSTLAQLKGAALMLAACININIGMVSEGQKEFHIALDYLKQDKYQSTPELSDSVKVLTVLAHLHLGYDALLEKNNQQALPSFSSKVLAILPAAHDAPNLCYAVMALKSVILVCRGFAIEQEQPGTILFTGPAQEGQPHYREQQFVLACRTLPWNDVGYPATGCLLNTTLLEIRCLDESVLDKNMEVADSSSCQSFLGCGKLF
jgi:hypothetical protein